MKDFVTLPLHAEFKGAKVPSAPVKIIPTAQDSTFWLGSWHAVQPEVLNELLIAHRNGPKTQRVATTATK